MGGFGKIFNINIFGESHGEIVGVVINGCPSGIKIGLNDFKSDIGRRRAGKKGGTSRKETDAPFIKTGVLGSRTTGAPITILFENKNTRGGDYDFVKEQHKKCDDKLYSGDYDGAITSSRSLVEGVAMKKYSGYNDLRGGGHFSGRLTLPLVAAGVIAKKIVEPICIKAKILEIGGTRDFTSAINLAIKEKDSIGGIIECSASNIPVGLGEPFFDSIESLISHLVFSIPAVKGIEFGAGFASTEMRGSIHNDMIIDGKGKTATNNSGGINGGITNGNPLIYRVAVKPTPSIGKEQKTFNMKTRKIVSLSIKGRHDACIALRVSPAIEAATAIVLADLLMLQKRNSWKGDLYGSSKN